MKEYKKWGGESVVEPKLDGVHARVTRDGARTKTGKSIKTVPHINKALRRHFKKNPGSVVDGELYRRGQSFEKTLGKFRGGEGKKLKLYVHGAEKPSRLTRHVRRVKGKVVKDEKGLQKAHVKHLRKSYEGSVVKRGGEARKLKPHFDEELPVVGSKVRKDGRAGVVSVRGSDGKVFKVQGSAGESARAKSGDKATVVYSKSSGGAVRGGKLKAVRNRDFSHEFTVMKTKNIAGKVLKRLKKKVPKRVLAAVNKVPKPIRRGALIGSAVPVPGGGLAGAGVGALSMGKNAVEGAVRRRLGRPYRLFSEKSEGLKPGIYKGKRGVRAMPFFNHEYMVAVPRKGESLGKDAKRLRNIGGSKAMVLGAYNKRGKLKSGVNDKYDVADLKRNIKDLKLVSTRGVDKAARAALDKSKKFKGKRYPGVVRNILGLGKNSNSYARTLIEGSTGMKVKSKISDRAPGARRRVEMSSVEFATKEERAKAKRRKLYMKQRNARDNWAKTRDGVAIAGTAAVGTGAVMSGMAARKTAIKAGQTIDELKDVAKSTMGKAGDTLGAVKGAANRTSGKSVADAITKKATKKVGDAFPTLRKVGRALVKKRKFFEAEGGVIDFSKDSLRDIDDDTFANTLRVASGQQKAHDPRLRDAKGEKLVKGARNAVDLPLNDIRVIKAGMAKGARIQKGVTRGSAVVKDAADVLRGKERGKDGSGRKKKREWEKGYFKRGVKTAIAGAGVLAYTRGIKKSKKFRGLHQSMVKKVKGAAERVAPGGSSLFSEGYQTPAEIQFAYGVRDTPANEHLRRVKDSKTKLRNDSHIGTGALVGAGVVGGLGVARAASKNNAKKRAAVDTIKAMRSQGVFRGNPKSTTKPLIDSARRAVKNKGLKGKMALGALGAYAGSRIGSKIGAKFRKEEKGFALADARPQRNFSTPADVEFDAQAAASGWDVRDPRGRSARVFAPGSRRRVRREKEWHEKKENQKKMVMGAVLATTLAGAAAGYRMGKGKGAFKRKLPVKPKAPVKKVVNGPWKGSSDRWV
jgi:hypothetical protein